MKRFLAALRMIVLSAVAVTLLPSCALLGAAIQLVGKVVDAFSSNAVASSPVFLNMSVPIRADESGAVVGPGAEIEQAAK